MAAGRIGPLPEWVASAFVWLAVVPGALGWSWWHVVWMADHARDLARRLRELGQSVETGSQSVAVLGVAVNDKPLP